MKPTSILVLISAVAIGATSALAAEVSKVAERNRSISLVLARGAMVRIVPGDIPTAAPPVDMNVGMSSGVEIEKTWTDYTSGLLFSRPGETYPRRRLVYSSTNDFQTAGILPGASDISIPVDAESNRLVTRRYLKRDDQSNDIDYSEFRSGDFEKSVVELRARSSPRQVLLRKDSDQWLDGASYACFSKANSGFWGGDITSTVGATFDVKWLVDGKMHREQALLGSIADCWPNGEILLRKLSEPGIRFKRIDPGSMAMVELSSDLASRDCQALGIDGRYAACMVRSPVGNMYTVVVFDFEKKRTVTVELGDEKFSDFDGMIPMGLSRDRLSWYLVDGYFERRDRVRTGSRLFRLRVSDTSSLREIVLPAALAAEKIVGIVAEQ
ncbi:MAG: hypothetical protein ABI411_11820 [Tahibacter sp.]